MPEDAPTACVVNLNDFQDVPTLGRNQIIQQAALNQLFNRLQSRLATIPPLSASSDSERFADGSPLNFDRRHSTIVIHGGRGSGKTTFIRSALRLLSKGDGLAARENGLSLLGVIDPTLIESKEHFFIIVVNKIKRAVSFHYDNIKNENSKSQFQSWQDSLKKMAEGFTLLDGIGPERPLQDAWEDPNYILQKGLEKADAATRLEEKFYEFVKKSLNFLEKKAFLLALDDIDTNFRSGWQILEVLRKYMASPHIITVMSGDLDLYAMLIRGQQWNNFESKHLKYDVDEHDSIFEMINHLQSQYMLKILRPDNRITLLPISKINHEIRVIPVNASPPSEQNSEEIINSIELRKYFGEFVFDCLYFAEVGNADIVELLLSQPIRTILHILRFVTPRRADTPGMLRAKVDVEGLASVFTDVLLRFDISPDHLRETEDALFPAFVAWFLTKNKLWGSGHSLYPNHKYVELNQVNLLLGAWLCDAMFRKPHIAIDYMLRVCLANEILNGRMMEFLEGEDREQNLVGFAQLDQNVPVTQVTSRLLVATHLEKRAGLRFGAIQTYKARSRIGKDIGRLIYGIAPEQRSDSIAYFKPTADSFAMAFLEKITQKHAQYLADIQPGELKFYIKGNICNTIGSLADFISGRMGLFSSLPAFEVVSPLGERSSIVAVPKLIGFVGRMMALAPNATSQEFQYLLRDETTDRSFPGSRAITTPESSVSDLDEDFPGDVFDEIGSSTDTQCYETFEKALLSWINEQINPSNIILPAYVLARIYDRFSVNLESIYEAIPKKDYFLGHLVHRHIVAFLNAVLIEEILYRSEDMPKILKSAVEDDRTFLANYTTNDRCPFFNRLFSCPLWGLYLSNDELSKPGAVTVVSHHRSACGKYFSPGVGPSFKVVYVDPFIRKLKSESAAEIEFDNLYPLLNSIPVIGVEVGPKSTVAPKTARRARGRPPQKSPARPAE